MDIPIGIYTDVIEFLVYEDIIKLLGSCLFMNNIIKNDILNKGILKKAKRKYDYYFNIQKWKKIFYGTQDEEIDMFVNGFETNGIVNAILCDKKKSEYKNKKNVKSKFIKTETLSFKNDRFVSKLDGNVNTIYKNLKCTNMDCIEIIKLEIGGSQIDKIYTNIVDVIQHLYSIKDKTTVPFDFCKKNNFVKYLLYHDICIYIKMKDGYTVDDFEMTIDVYELDDIDKTFYVSDIKNKKTVDYYNTIISKTGETSFDDTGFKKKKMMLNLNHPTSYLILDCGIIESLDIYFVRDHDSGITLEDIYMYNGKYIIPLTPSLDKINEYCVNFSRMEQPILEITFKNENNKCDIYSICHNTMVIGYEMGGLKFAN
jgi:hypothetical protein